MKILFTCRTYFPEIGGAACCVEDIAEALSRAGHDSTIVASLPSSAVPAKERQGHVQILRLDYPPSDVRNFRELLFCIRRSIAFFVALSRAIRREGTEVICIGLVGIDSAFIALLNSFRRLRLVVYLHGSELRSYVKISPAVRWSLRRCLRRCDAAVAVSEDLRDEAEAFCPGIQHKLFVIPNRVNAERIRGTPAYSHRAPYVLYAGRLNPVKGAGLLLQAFDMAARRLEGVNLLLAGDGPEQPELKKTASRLAASGRIHFLGARPRHQIFALLRGCELVVVPSVTEACPLIVLEAMAAGKVVLGSCTTGIRDLILDGETGMLFEPGDAKGLAELLVRFYNSPELRHSLEANTKKHADAMLDEYQDFLERHIRLLTMPGTNSIR